MSASAQYKGERDYNGLFSGEGELVCDGGVVYSGAFADGAFHGAGQLTYPSGHVYRARWVAGVEVPGSGSYQWKDGLPYNCPPDFPASEAQLRDPARWPFLHDFDRRLWPEHKGGVRADASYVQRSREQQLSSLTLGVAGVPKGELGRKVAAAVAAKAAAAQ